MELRGGRSRGRIVVVGLALLVVLLVPAGCKRLDLRKLEGLVSTEIKSRTGVDVASVTCPEKRDLKAGDEFECTLVMAGNRSFVVKVKQTDDDGNVEWNVPHIMDPAGVAAAITAQLQEKVPDLEVAVDCGVLYLLGDMGSSFPCTVRPAAGVEFGITVTMTDADGTFSWKRTESGESGVETAPATPPSE